MVERPAAAPGLLDDAEEFVAARITLVVVQEVAVALLFGVVAAADDMHGQAAIAELVEGGQLARGQGRRDKPGAVRQQDAELFRLRGDIRGDLEAVDRSAAVGHQHAVETGVFVGAGDGAEKSLVDDRTGAEHGFGHFLGGAKADEFDAHFASFVVVVAGGRDEASGSERGAPAVDQNGVVLRRVDAAAQHVAVMALQGVGVRQARIAAQFDGFFHHLYRLVGDQVFDAEAVVRCDASRSGAGDQGGVGKQPGVDQAQRFLEARQAG